MLNYLKMRRWPSKMVYEYKTMFILSSFWVINIYEEWLGLPFSFIFSTNHRNNVFRPTKPEKTFLARFSSTKMKKKMFNLGNFQTKPSIYMIIYKTNAGKVIYRKLNQIKSWPLENCWKVILWIAEPLNFFPPAIFEWELKKICKNIEFQFE